MSSRDADAGEVQRTAYIDALHREHAGYLRYNRDDRATQVAAVLAQLGAPITHEKPRHTRRNTSTTPMPTPTKAAGT